MKCLNKTEAPFSICNVFFVSKGNLFYFYFMCEYIHVLVDEWLSIAYITCTVHVVIRQELRKSQRCTIVKFPILNSVQQT